MVYSIDLGSFTKRLCCKLLIIHYIGRHTEFENNLKNQIEMRKLFNRLVGVLIIVKTLIIPTLLIIFLCFIFMFLRQASGIVHEGDTNVSEDFTKMDLELGILKKEVNQFRNQVVEAGEKTKQFTEDAKKTIRPIVATLGGIQTVIVSVVGTIGVTVNAILGVVKKIPFVGKNIKLINMSKIYSLNLIPIDFPDLDLNFSLNVDSFNELRMITEQISLDITTAMDKLQALFFFWLKLFVFAFFLIFLWIGITIVGFFLRMRKALRVGWNLILGREEESALLYL